MVSPKPPAIDIEALSFTYPDKTVALKGLDLKVADGECLVIVGPNGAGKSTLLLSLNGLIETEGKITIKAEVMNKKNLKEIRRLVGVVFQDPDDQLFMPTVFEDVAFGPINMGMREEEVHARVHQSLGLVGMDALEGRLSHHLSFGEKKLICIATVLAMDPAILVFDEPTANLDPRARRHLISLLMDDLRQTKVISTHDMNFAAEVADHVVILYKSKIVADGPAREILTDERLLLEYGLEMPTNIDLKS
jgi:cobalt transport protein ATP-binding subunit